MIYAALDIGTNTFRLMVAEKNGSLLSIVARERLTIRLGENIAETGLICNQALVRGREGLRVFRKILDRYPGCVIRACGTAALRKAKNNGQFLTDARGILGFPIEVISGPKEAMFSLQGALDGLAPEAKRKVLLADVGGGSTEIIFSDMRATTGRNKNGKIDLLPTVKSLDLGAVTLTTTCREKGDMIRHIQQVLQFDLSNFFSQFKRNRSEADVVFIATGGTASALGLLHLNLDQYESQRIQGLRLGIEDLDTIEQRLTGLSIRERENIHGLGEGRGEILPAGIRIYQELCRKFHFNSMIISENGLLEGILLSLVSSDNVKLTSSDE